MLRPIVRFGEHVLQRPTVPVTVFDAELDRLIDDMIDTMYAAPGIGLAAPQVGEPQRICVIDLSVGKKGGDLLTLINPEFVEREGMQLEDEGCLSVPWLQRHAWHDPRARSCAPSTARGSRASSRPPVCSPARSSTKSIIWTACCSSIGSGD